MKVVVGLGNPGSQYARTRHNMGFRIVDRIATQLGWHWSERRWRAILSTGIIGTEKVILVKPLTFMNLSGQAVGDLMRWYNTPAEDLLVICDDLDLPVGKIRLRSQGSAGGQKGLESIITHLHTNQFPRLRIGIGRPANHHRGSVDYVLGVPTGDEHRLLETGEDRATEAIQMFVTQGVSLTMNLVNADP